MKILSLLQLPFLVPLFFTTEARAETKNAILHLDLQKTTFSLTLNAPMDTLVGFRHAPTSPQEKEELDKALTILKSPTLIFDFPKVAGCQVQLKSLDMDLNQRTLQSNPQDPKDPKTIVADQTQGNVTAVYGGTCEKPKAFKSFSTQLFGFYPELGSIGLNATIDKNKATLTKALRPKETGGANPAGASLHFRK